MNVVGFAPSLNSTIQRPARAPRNSAFNETGCGAGVDQQTPGYSPSSADYFVFGTAVSLVARASVSRRKPIPHDLRIPACASMPAAPEIRSGNAIRNGQFSGPGGKADSNPRSRLSRKGLLERPAGSVLTSGRLPRRRWLRAPSPRPLRSRGAEGSNLVPSSNESGSRLQGVHQDLRAFAACPIAV